MSSAEFDGQANPVDLKMAAPAADGTIPESEAVIAAEDAWNFARCNPPTFAGRCPKTAIVHLECLEQKSKEEGTWNSLEECLKSADFATNDASVVRLTSRTRDKMLAITQSFLHKALEIHRGGNPKSGYASPRDFNFIVLPPTKILEYFLRSYVRSLSVYYPLVVAGQVDPNEMLQNNQASTLLLLLMIAQGAAAMPMAEARYLSAGLTETCRISLFDIVEKDVELSADPTALRCALLFIVLGAWSGDKWLMDIAMGQRGMYMSMLKHAGMLEPQSHVLPNFNAPGGPELQWRSWLQRESQNRLVYNYVMLDQELSLFHDTAPLFAITELQCPMPGPEMLWMAPDAEQWMVTWKGIYGSASHLNLDPTAQTLINPSLNDLFQEFLHDGLAHRSNLSPQQMRLILHPIQALLYHLRQMLSCFPASTSSRQGGLVGLGAPTVTKPSTSARLQEVQGLLQTWYKLTDSYHQQHPDCPVTRCNLVLYHLIALNAVTNFPEIERLARREGFSGYWDLSLRQGRCFNAREEAIFHCGQIAKHLRLMPSDRRPAWWSAAMYRATLILWADSICRFAPDLSGSHPAAANSTFVAVDQVSPGDLALNAFMWKVHTVPNTNVVAVLSQKDGSHISLDNPADVLLYAIKNIEDGPSSRIGDGLKRRIIKLRNNWNVNLSSSSAQVRL